MDEFSSLLLDVPQEYEGKLMSFDFGLKHIGVAIGQTFTKNANPLKTLAAMEGVPRDWAELDHLIRHWRPQAFIVGIPLNMDGTHQSVTIPARDFAFLLKARYNLAIHGYDERLTTKEAKSRLFDSHGYKALKKDKVDAVSAALILEGWMQQFLL
jgi:putative holliday junction resolvase